MKGRDRAAPQKGVLELPAYCGADRTEGRVYCNGLYPVLFGVFTVKANVTLNKSQRYNIKSKIYNVLDKRGFQVL